MIRFKVVKASRILLCLAVLLLAAVVCAIVLSGALGGGDAGSRASASLVMSDAAPGAETVSVFAPGESPFDPGDESEAVAEESASPAPARRPSVLIYHTHTHEAYEQVSADPYEAVEAWRTTDNGHSVVRVGEELARCLEAEGFEVVHDVTDHENDALSTAYTRSLETLKSYDRPFDLYIDLHRDAWIEGMKLRYTDSDGTRYAQPMVLIGNGVGFDEKPYYAQNLAFARVLTERINQKRPGLCKEVLVKDGRYNQHIGIFSILIEFGHNKNTLAEALAAAPAVAEALGSMMLEAPDAALEAMRPLS